MMNMGDKEVVSHASYVHWVGKKHGPIMYQQILWEEGCVFYCRTTQPQTIMHLETNSNIYGRTLHPHNRNLTPGGSSGGESALIGFRGSIFVRCFSLAKRHDEAIATNSNFWTAGNGR